MKKALNVSRRNFLKTTAAVGGGLTVGVAIPDALAADPKAAELNVWVQVRPDDLIIIKYARSEMGQGSMTAAAQLVAEELECNWRRVRVEYADANEHVRRKRAWGDMAAVGSRTIRLSQQYLRTGGAQAREMLIAAAAQRWGVDASECRAENGFVVSKNKKINYGALAQAASKLEPPKEVKLKDPKDWKIAGKPIPRVDIPATVLGRQTYGIDARLPGMVYAAVLQCPVFGGTVKSVDAAKVQGRRGIIKVLPFDNWVAVVADNWWRAKQAAAELPVEWDAGKNGAVTSASIMQFLREGLTQKEVAVPLKDGDVEKALAGAAKVVEAEYFTPFQAHCTMEPMCALALVKSGRVDVWTSSQNYEGTLASAAATAGVPLENAYAHRVQLGGGFGRRGAQDYTQKAVLIAKAMEGTPVKMVWTREEDMQHDNYRPVSLIRMKGGLDAQGKVVAMHSRVAAPSIIGTLLRLPLKGGIDPQAVASYADQPYAIPNVAVEYAQRNPHVPVGFWRTVGHSQNPFMRESFIDELAHAAGKDPLEFRRAMLDNSKRELGILEATAKAAGWGQALPAGVHRGIAVTEAYGSYTACVAEVSVDAQGELKVHRLVVGMDCGYAVNPDNIEAQIQGSAVFALGATLWQEITVKDGRVEQSNFHDYRMMKLAEMPKVEMVLAPSGGFWGGIGEPGQAAIPPAICNAIFAATGKRIRSLPLKNHDLKRA